MTESTVPAFELPRLDLPVFDLHCDLLTYLHVQPERTPYDPASRCSLSQLRAGNVALQVLALFSVTGPGSSRTGMEQASLFRHLCDRHRDEVVAWAAAGEAKALPEGDGRLGVVAAIESASVFCDETEPLGEGLARLEEIERLVAPVLYVSLTWTQENRFGGGNLSDAGLKDDGRTLIQFLSERRIALDFSHMSPRMAREVLEYLSGSGLSIPVLASHSGFAARRPIPRNLPDDVARELIRRDGVIGLNFMIPYLGDEPDSFAEHLARGLELGGRRHLCLGADFFCTDDVPEEMSLCNGTKACPTTGLHGAH